MFLFGKRSKKIIQRMMVVVGILVALGMLALYFPALYQ